MTYRDFPPYFADAETDRKDAEYVIFGVPYDRTGSFRQGTAEGPAAIRRAAWNNELYHIPTGGHTETWKAHDVGDIDIDNSLDPETMVKRTYEFTKTIAQAGQFPILLGGEHNVPMGAVQAIAEAYEDLVLVQIDAHLDYRDEYDGSRFNHANALRRFCDHISTDDVAIIGVRSAEREELAAAERDGVHRIFTSFDVKERGIQAVLDQVLRDFAGRPLYLTIDIDGIDPAYAPGTGTPEPFGLSDWDALETVRRCAPQLVGLDVVEVCPPYDNGQTAMLASKLVREAIFWREDAKKQGTALAPNVKATASGN
jgi:agmatinase